MEGFAWKRSLPLKQTNGATNCKFINNHRHGRRESLCTEQSDHAL